MTLTLGEGAAPSSGLFYFLQGLFYLVGLFRGEGLLSQEAYDFGNQFPHLYSLNPLETDEFELGHELDPSPLQIEPELLRNGLDQVFLITLV